VTIHIHFQDLDIWMHEKPEVYLSQFGRNSVGAMHKYFATNTLVLEALEALEGGEDFVSQGMG
jgi:hypothetical protein